MWAYDLEADTWTEKGSAPVAAESSRSGSTTRSRASSWPRGTTATPDTPDLGAVELRGRDRHVDPDPPGEPAGHRTPGVRLRRLRRPDRRVRRRRGARRGQRRGSSTSAPAPGRGRAPSRRSSPTGGWADRARDRLRRGGRADRDGRPGPIGRLRRDRGPLGDPVRDALRGSAGRVRHPPGVPPGAPDGLRPGERAARRLRGHGLHDVHVGGGGRHVGVRHGDPLVDARRAPDPGAASPAGPDRRRGAGLDRTRTGRPGSAPRR